jgi:hypothetical protein
MANYEIGRIGFMFESLQRFGFVFFLLLLTSSAHSVIERNSPQIAPPEVVQSEAFSTSDVRFQSHSQEYNTYFTPSGLIVAGFTSSDEGPQYFELGMQLLGSQKDVEITTLNPMLASNDQWLTTLPDYAQIKYANVYPGIDMICYGNTDELEMRFLVAAGGNVHRIRLRLTGDNTVEPTSDGGVRLIAGNKAIDMPRPVGFQVDAFGMKQPVEARYVVNSRKEISLSIGAFDPKRPLLLNP